MARALGGINWPMRSSQALQYRAPNEALSSDWMDLVQAISEEFEAQGLAWGEAEVSPPWDENAAPESEWDPESDLDNLVRLGNWSKHFPAVSDPQVDRDVEIVTNPITEAILAARTTAQIDEGFRITANSALEDALAVVRDNKLEGSPLAVFSDDGILSLQWERDRYGVGLIFAGDGVVSVVFRGPDKFYAENGIEVPVETLLPREFNDALTGILK
jgi:hypothetical protein